MKKRMNRKGFTLIELLAVIIILAILMTLAITAMSGYIRGARKDTFVTTAQQYANSVRLSFVNGEYSATVMPSRGKCLVVSTNTVALESGSHESPFGQTYSDDSYIDYKFILDTETLAKIRQFNRNKKYTDFDGEARTKNGLTVYYSDLWSEIGDAVITRGTPGVNNEGEGA